MESLKSWFGWVLLVLLVLVLFGSYTVIPAGHRGVVYSKLSGVQQRVMTEGFNFKAPFIESVTKYNCRTQKFMPQQPVEGASKDLQLVKVEIAVNYHVDPLKVQSLFREVGRDYEDMVIAPAVSEVVKAATAQFPVEQIIVERPKLREIITNSLTEKLARYYIVLENMNITDIDFSAEFNKVVEEKQIEEQKIKTAEYKKRQAEQDKQAAILTAEGQAEAQRLLRASASKETVALKWIERWDGHLKPFMSGSGVVPMIDMKGIEADQ